MALCSNRAAIRRLRRRVTGRRARRGCPGSISPIPKDEQSRTCALCLVCRRHLELQAKATRKLTAIKRSPRCVEGWDLKLRARQPPKSFFFAQGKASSAAPFSRRDVARRLNLVGNARASPDASSRGHQRGGSPVIIGQVGRESLRMRLHCLALGRPLGVMQAYAWSPSGGGGARTAALPPVRRGSGCDGRAKPLYCHLRCS